MASLGREAADVTWGFGVFTAIFVAGYYCGGRINLGFSHNLRINFFDLRGSNGGC